MNELLAACQDAIMPAAAQEKYEGTRESIQRVMNEPRKACPDTIMPAAAQEKYEDTREPIQRVMNEPREACQDTTMPAVAEGIDNPVCMAMNRVGCMGDSGLFAFREVAIVVEMGRVPEDL
jgi:hypothetical protein